MAEEFNPFEDADEAPEEPTPAPKKPATRKRSTTPPTAKKETTTMSETTETGGMSITHKGGTAFDAPWIVLHPKSPEEAAEFYGLDPADYATRQDLLKALFEAVQLASAFFVAKAPEKPAAASNGGGSGATAGNTRRAPQGAQEAPGGQTKECAHGEMVYKTGVTQSGKNAGKTWRAFMCPAPKGADQCSPEWLK